MNYGLFQARSSSAFDFKPRTVKTIAFVLKKLNEKTKSNIYFCSNSVNKSLDLFNDSFHGSATSALKHFQINVK